MLAKLGRIRQKAARGEHERIVARQPVEEPYASAKVDDAMHVEQTEREVHREALATVPIFVRKHHSNALATGPNLVSEVTQNANGLPRDDVEVPLVEEHSGIRSLKASLNNEQALHAASEAI
eukprot:943941-Karenia_brevis.AAC.1